VTDRFIEVSLDSLPEETQSAVRDIMAREGVEQAEALQRLLEMGARAAQDRREQDLSAEQAVRFMKSLLPPEEPG
jgi:hypothetical protein